MIQNHKRQRTLHKPSFYSRRRPGLPPARTIFSGVVKPRVICCLPILLIQLALGAEESLDIIPMIKTQQSLGWEIVDAGNPLGVEIFHSTDGINWTLQSQLIPYQSSYRPNSLWGYWKVRLIYSTGFSDFSHVLLIAFPTLDYIVLAMTTYTQPIQQPGTGLIETKTMKLEDTP